MEPSFQPQPIASQLKSTEVKETEEHRKVTEGKQLAEEETFTLPKYYKSGSITPLTQGKPDFKSNKEEKARVEAYFAEIKGNRNIQSSNKEERSRIRKFLEDYKLLIKELTPNSLSSRVKKLILEAAKLKQTKDEAAASFEKVKTQIKLEVK